MATPSLDSARAADAAIEKAPDFLPEALPGRRPSLVGLTRDALKAVSYTHLTLPTKA